METGAPLSRAEVAAKYGDWTAMCIHLGGEEWTLDPPRSDRRLRRFVQIVADLSRKPIQQLRVLDLGCLEGHYAIEFAKQGAKSVGIEIREVNIEKARWTKDRLGLPNVDFYQDDVRNLSRQKYGAFDVVLCAGILYHLPAPDVFEFVKRIHEVCDHLVIFDTFFGLHAKVSAEYGGKRYWGLHYREHDDNASAAQKAKDLWASIDNSSSFWLTHVSLCNLMSQVGFTSFFECHNPSMPDQFHDRRTYVAVKGQPARVVTSPLTDQEIHPDMPEHRPWKVNAVHLTRSPIRELLKRLLPQPVKNVMKPLLRAVRLMEPDSTLAWHKRQMKQERRKSTR